MAEQDLTRGPIFRGITRFALPMLLGDLFQQTYNLVDSWVVGRFVSAGALAGVGSSYTLMNFLTAILLGLSLGSGVVYSVCFGRRDEEQLDRCLGTSFLLIAAVAAVITILPLLLTNQILGWLNIPEEIRSLTGTYLHIVFCGIPAVFLYNFFAAYLKALGNSVTPLIALVISTALNILLDLLFVIPLGWGTAGAGLATLLAQYASGIGICVYVLVRQPRVRAALRRARPEVGTLRFLSGYVFFTALQQSVMQLGILMIQGLVNRFGTAVMAAFAAASKIDSFAYMPALEYANACSTFLAQNRGAGERRRMVRGMQKSVLTILVYCAAISLTVWFLAGPVIGLFVGSNETAMIGQGVRYLHIEGTFYCAYGILMFFYGLYRALGKPWMSLVLTVCSLGTRVVLGYALAPIPAIGVLGIWWAVPIGWFLADGVGLGCLLARRRGLLGVPEDP